MHAAVLSAVNDAARRPRRLPSSLICPPWGGQPAGWQVGAEGWSLFSRTKGWRFASRRHEPPVRTVAGDRVEDHQQLAHAGDNDDLRLLAGQPLGEDGDDRV